MLYRFRGCGDDLFDCPVNSVRSVKSEHMACHDVLFRRCELNEG